MRILVRKTCILLYFIVFYSRTPRIPHPRPYRTTLHVGLALRNRILLRPAPVPAVGFANPMDIAGKSLASFSKRRQPSLQNDVSHDAVAPDRALHVGLALWGWALLRHAAVSIRQKEQHVRRQDHQRLHQYQDQYSVHLRANEEHVRPWRHARPTNKAQCQLSEDMRRVPGQLLGRSMEVKYELRVCSLCPS